MAEEKTIVIDRSKQGMDATQIVDTAIEQAGGIVKQLLQAGMSNPLLGAVTGLIVTNILLRTKIIDDNTALGINLLIFSAAGLALTNEVIQDFTKIFSLSGNSNPSLLEPSASTLVFTEGSNNAQLNALLGQLAAQKTVKT